jgi:hypothetical protein
MSEKMDVLAARDMGSNPRCKPAISDSFTSFAINEGMGRRVNNPD